MRPSTFLLALLATVATATPQPGNKSVCTTTLGRCTSTVTATSTKYTSTTTKVHTITAGTSTKTITTTTVPIISSCAAPTTTGPVGKRGAPGENCWSVNTVTQHYATTTTVTVKAVSTIQSTRTIAKTTVTKTQTATSTATQTALANNFAGDFYIYDASGENAFDVSYTRDGQQYYLFLDSAAYANTFALVSGALNVPGTGLGSGNVYTDPSAASAEGFPDNTALILDPSQAASQGAAATLLSCSLSQNSDGTCPLTCTGNPGSQFYYCQEELGIFLGAEDGSGEVCDSPSDYTPISPFVVGPVS